MNISKIKSPVFAAGAAILLTLGLSAFKPAATPNYGKDASGNWNSLTGLTPVGPLTQPGPGEYRCIPSTEVCTAEFSYENPENNADDYQSVGSEGIFEKGE